MSEELNSALSELRAQAEEKLAKRISAFSKRKFRPFFWFWVKLIGRVLEVVKKLA